MRPRRPLAVFVALGVAGFGETPQRAAGEPPPSASPKPAVEPPRASGPAQTWAPPDDPIQRGPTTLALTVLDQETGAPQSGTVVLWRLDAPGNVAWLSGDQRQAEVVLEAGRGEAVDLPDGRYRAVFLEQSRAADDPAELEIRGARTEITLRVPMPRSYPVSLRLLDERGVPLLETSIRASGSGGSYNLAVPTWVRARLLRGPLHIGGGFTYSGWAAGDTHPLRWLRAEDGVFTVGVYAEPSRGKASHRSMYAIPPGRNDVAFAVGCAAGPTTHLGVALPLALLLEQLRLPDGAPVAGSKARVEARCRTHLVTADMPPDRWRSLAIEITVRIDGYEPLRATADADHPSPTAPPWVPVTAGPARSAR